MINLPWKEIEEGASKHGLEPDWVAACIMTETNGNMFAVRYEPAFKYLYTPRIYAEKLNLSVETEETCQKMSWGYMQVMGAVCRELGFQGHIPQVLDPSINIDLGCKKIQNLMNKYGDIFQAIAAYNAGSVRKTAGGFFVNQKHVDRFDSWLRKIKEGH